MNSCTINCEGVDGQVFQNLDSGSYTLFIEANGTADTREFAFDSVGPITVSIGRNTAVSRAFGNMKCLIQSCNWYKYF